ncbi:phosphotransferase [Alicyclobacillus macrosporangiidus]|uniref:phosphotransferase n=1 Tax=Alicyclobacillus macrosporangiidus TaxID=392015 RepID=UPI0026F2D77D|nr:phosphotransferase [Alicyclobacillus macrosporangiidus]
MRSLEERIAELIQAANDIGLHATDGQVLSDGGNLIVRLLPCDCVCRVMTLFGDENPTYWRDVLSREVRVAQYLHGQGVPVVTPVSNMDPGPHPVGNTWFTVWEYVSPVEHSDLSVDEAYVLLRKVEVGLKTYPHALPILGTWKPVESAVENLSRIDDERVTSLIRFWETVDRRLKALPRNELVPVHGDAHLGNLIASASGWLWMDFEDCSLMPPFWDLAAAVGRTYLFGEERPFSNRLMAMYLGEIPSEEVVGQFNLALAARLVQSMSLNLDLTLHGHGNADLCWRRVENGLHVLAQIV